MGKLYRTNHPLMRVALLPVLAVAACAGLRFLLRPILGDSAPLNLFYLAVMSSAIFGGAWAGSIATILSLLAGCFFFMQPAFSFAQKTSDDFRRCIMFGLVGLAVSLMSARLSFLRRKSEETAAALRISEARFRRLWDTDVIGVFHWNLDGRVTDANDAFLRITGYSRDDLRDGRVNWIKMTPPEYEQGDQKAIEELEQVGHDTPFAKEYIRKDGVRIWVQLGGALIGEKDGVSYCLDIDERRKAELRVRESEQRLRLAGEAAEIGFWTYDAQIQKVTLDATSRELFGLPLEKEISPAEFRAKIHPDDITEAMDHVKRALSGEAAYFAQFRVPRADGSHRWIASKGDVVRDSAGGIAKLTGVHWDITVLKQAEAEREQLLTAERNARAQAERANRIKDEFLATISHELRTPLNAVLGWAQILKRGKDKADIVEEGLDVIERNARAQAKLIEDLLDMSRIISGKVKLDIQPLSIHDAVNAAIETIRPSAQLKEIEIVTDISSAEPVLGDSTRLQQVFWNLLSNAIKFTPKKGTVRVNIQASGPQVVASIEDNGIGMSEAFLQHAFDRFTQAEASTTRRSGGLGLGLSIVKQLVELHGGSVSAYSAGENRGSRFVVSLPIATKKPSLEPGNSKLPEQASLDGIQILAVDDEPDARNLIARVLSDSGASVSAVESAEDALTSMQSNKPDILICDIGMPDVDGYELMRRVRTLPQDAGGKTPAIALTAFARPEDRAKALLAGYQMHIAKPLNATELINSIAMLAQARKGA